MDGFKIFSLLALFTLPVAALAGEQGFHFSGSAMALTNQTQQGGQGPQGSTVLTHTDVIYSGNFWAVGAFFQYDRQGSNQTDLGLGPKIELHYGPFYVEGGYIALMQRSFTDRSIATEKGEGWLLGVGTRFMLGASSSSGGAGTSGFYLQFAYKYRYQMIYEQDNFQLTQPITQQDGYPTFGIGYLF